MTLSIRSLLAATCLLGAAACAPPPDSNGAAGANLGDDYSAYSLTLQLRSPQIPNAGPFGYENHVFVVQTSDGILHDGQVITVGIAPEVMVSYLKDVGESYAHRVTLDYWYGNADDPTAYHDARGGDTTSDPATQGFSFSAATIPPDATSLVLELTINGPVTIGNRNTFPISPPASAAPTDPSTDPTPSPVTVPPVDQPSPSVDGDVPMVGDPCGDVTYAGYCTSDKLRGVYCLDDAIAITNCNNGCNDGADGASCQ